MKTTLARVSPKAPSAIPRQHRILVAEDSILLADRICESLQERGHCIVGPTASLQEASELARTADLDAAVLDLKLGNELCFPIATQLKARGIPFVILTGYPVALNPWGVEPDSWILKPMEPSAVTEAVDRMLAERAVVSEPSPPAIVAPAGTGIDKAARPRVLLVDGDPRTRAALAALLAKRGFDVQCLDENPALHGALNGVRCGPPSTEKIACGRLIIDLPQRRVWWDGVDVPLTAGEFSIVVLLATHAGRCVDHRTVYDCVHYKGFISGHGDKGFWVNVRSAIRHIRKKFRAVDNSFDELENARAFGYRWRKPD